MSPKKRSKSSVTVDLYAEVTNHIIAALEAGTPPWICPWNAGEGTAFPANLATNRLYRGINVLLLNLRQMTAGYATNRWLTFQQAHALGAQVRRGECGTRIVFFKLLEQGDAKQVTHVANDEGARRVVPLLRSFTVFNQDQVDGLAAALTWPTPAPEWNPCEAAEALMARSGAVIRHEGLRACYSPSLDCIRMPSKDTFAQAEGYYATALHELTHWTGHPTRCNRALSTRQHIEAYAFEELVAEMGSAFLSSHCGLPTQLHHASYIASWLEALRNDKRLVFSAASIAQKAVDFLLPEIAAPKVAQTQAQEALA